MYSVRDASGPPIRAFQRRFCRTPSSSRLQDRCDQPLVLGIFRARIVILFTSTIQRHHTKIVFDTHCHLQTAAFDEDRQQVIDRSRAAGVTDMLIPAIDRASIPATLKLAEDTGVYAGIGIHPHHALEWTEA